MNTQAGFFSKNCVRATLIALAALPLFSFANDPLLKEKPAYTFDLSHWKITLPDGSERNAQWLQSGETVAEQFYFNSDGSMVFRSLNVAGTTTNSRYSRSELRKIFDAFGPQRMFWGTDLTRLSASYSEAVTMFTEHIDWLKGEDLDWVMGKGVCEWLQW